MPFQGLFCTERPVIGMVHLLPLPGAPGYQHNLGKIFERAVWEAEALNRAGVDGLMVENFGDTPFLAEEVEPIQLAVMAAITRDVRRAMNLPLGVNVQYNAWAAEMSIACACGADFIRVEVFVDTVLSPQGLIHPCAAGLTRLRKDLDAKVQIWADLQARHSTPLVVRSLVQSAIDAQNARADALILTGALTGQAAPLEALTEVKQSVRVPVLAGSGVTLENLEAALAAADGVIVGAALKEGGEVTNRVSEQAARSFMEAARKVQDCVPAANPV